MSNNKLIARNTLMLYLRMLFVMGIALYTVRIVLEELGIEDYGIHNAVVGFVSMFGFISQTITSSTQRFLSFEIGKNDSVRLNQMFSVSLTIFIVLSVFILLISETLGLWFVNNILTIPPNRLCAANVIYQLSILSFILTIISIPYKAMIISQEKMSMFAYIGIAEVVLKLIMILTMTFVSFDKLVVYGCIIFITNLLTTSMYYIYCTKYYATSRYEFVKDKNAYKEISSFASWSIFGALSGVADNHGNNILINIFFGPEINAARAIGFQIKSAIQSFSTNFYIATKPQIVKRYAEGKMDEVVDLFFYSTKYSFFLLLLLCLPILLETEYILNLWLKNVTSYMIIFTQLSLILSVVMSFQNPVTAVIYAAGSIKKYHLLVDSFTIISLPISYILFKFGMPPQTTLCVSIIVFMLAQIMRLVVLKSYFSYSLKYYVYKVLVPVLNVTLISLIIPVFVKGKLNLNETLNFVMIFIISIVSVIISVCLVGLNTNERMKIKIFLFKK